MIVLDAAVVIAHLSTSDPHSDAAGDILDTEEELAIHPLSLAEVLVHPAHTGQDVAIFERLTTRLGIETVTPTPTEPIELARLRAQTKLKMPGCCALVAAERLGAHLATFDRRLAEVARGRGVRVIAN
ncbi:type II toxin-antitoxin system VapC family toxin [Gordonia sp. X0973]|uniref:type II toxin-antitoxin system VapC family toxin n=1 Tax=Gordonia sp. X0973 TaxID=2742602 RepID=UPI0013EA7C49|nr:type II toxin-antitoxin system VapC family toxin [Gordonia sp. X0973]QKT08223.1 type II toxin-antitoxin system VapC family toxin [Gordonia sp. X0973]